FRYRAEWLGCKALATVVCWLPRRTCAGLADLLGAVAYHVDRRGRTVALANVAMAFGPRYDDAKRREIVRRSYQSFARTMVDLLWAPRLNRDNWRDYIIMEGDLKVLEQHRNEHDPERR